MITQTYNIDLVPNGKPLIVNVSQYDKLSRTLEFNIYSSGVLFEIPSGTSAVIQGTKLDGTGFSYNMTVSGSKVSMDIEQQMTVFDGDVHCEILLTKNAEQLGSANFILRVEKAAISDETIISETDIPIFRSFASGGSNGQVFVHGEGNEGNWGNLNATNVETSSDVAIKSASGNPVTINDALQGKALGVNTTLEPIQDLHGYDHPWAGGNGKNIAECVKEDSTTTSGATTFTRYADGTVRVVKSGSDTGTRFTNYLYRQNELLIPKEVPLIVSGGSTGNALVRVCYNAGSGTVTAATAGDEEVEFTIPSTAISTWVRIITAWDDYDKDFDVTLYPMVRLASETDPTFEPYSNVCPITGRTQVDVNRKGHNIWDEEWELGGIDIATGVPDTTTNKIRSKNFIGCLPETSYYVHFGGDGSITVYFYDNNDNYISRVSATRRDISTPSNAYKMKFACSTGYGTTYNNDISINYPAAFTEYELYAGQSVTVQLGQTVYGGTLNVTTGELTVDKAMVDLGTLTWQTRSTGSASKVLSSSLPNPYKTSYSDPREWKSEAYIEYEPSNAPILIQQIETTPIGLHSLRQVANTSTIIYAIVPKDTNPTGKLVYELATPQTIQLTPAQVSLLTGTNIITTNADDLSVMYYATGKGDVEGSLSFLLEKTARNETSINSLAGSLAMIETSPVTTNHAVGDLIVYNNQLYEVTVAIATGETLKVGTNISATTVGDELTSLSTQYNWTSYLSSKEQDSSASVRVAITHNIVVLSILTKSTTHSQDEVIMNIPEGFRPIFSTLTVGKVGSHELCSVAAYPNGQVKIWSMVESSNSGRFICQIVYAYR